MRSSFSIALFLAAFLPLVACAMPAEANPATLPPGVSDRLLFASGSTDLSEAAKATLRQWREHAAEHPRAIFKLTGHADAGESAGDHRRLSALRAVAAKRLLMSLGLSDHIVRAFAEGLSQPAGTCGERDCEAARAQNRRVVLEIDYDPPLPRSAAPPSYARARSGEIMLDDIPTKIWLEDR